MEGDAGCNTISVDDLGDVAGGDGIPLHCFQGKEAVRGPLRMANWDRLPVQASRDREGEDGRKENSNRAALAAWSVHESLPTSIKGQWAVDVRCIRLRVEVVKLGKWVMLRGPQIQIDVRVCRHLRVTFGLRDSIRSLRFRVQSCREP